MLGSRQVYAIVAIGLIALLSSSTTQSQPVRPVLMAGFDPNAIVFDSASLSTPTTQEVRWGSAFTEAGRNFAAKLGDTGRVLGSQAASDFAARERIYADNDARASGLPQSFQDVDKGGSLLGYLGNQVVQVSPYLGIVLVCFAILYPKRPRRWPTGSPP